MIQFNFESIKQRILTTLSSKTEWAEFLSFGTNSLLIDAIAQELAYEVQYKEYLTFENWWSLARNKSSLLVTAPIHGYVVPRKIGASGFIKVSASENFDVAYGKDIFIPKFFQFSNGDTYVCTTSITRLEASEFNISIPVKQGEYKEIKFLAVGDLFETKEIFDDSVDNSLFELHVNSILWNPVSSLFDHTPNELVYEIITSASFDKVTLRFGNDIFGKKLNANDSVIFKYISTKGKQGNIASKNNITTVESQAYDVDAKAVDLFVTNESPILGGFDYPDIEEIRSRSPKVFQAGDRASTREDYQIMLNTLEFISKSNVWGVYEFNIDNGNDPWKFIPTEENVVHLALLNSEFTNLTTLEKDRVIQIIYPKTSPTDILKFEMVEIINLIFDVNAVVRNSSYALLEVKNRIDLALKQNYGIESMNFNENIYFSDIYRFVDEIDGVRNHNITTYVEQKFNFIQAYLIDIRVPLFPMKSSQTIFYIKLKSESEDKYAIFATVNADGILISPLNVETGLPKYNFANSNLNLNNGVGQIVVISGLTEAFDDYNVKVEYTLVSNDLILKNRYQIFNGNKTRITVSYPF